MFLTILTATSATAAEPEEPKTPAPPRPEFRFETDKVVALGDPVMAGVQKDIATLAKWDIFVTHVAVVTLGVPTQEAAQIRLVDRARDSAWRIGRGPRSRRPRSTDDLRNVLQDVYTKGPNPPSAMVKALTGRRSRRPSGSNWYNATITRPFEVPPGSWGVSFRMCGRSEDEAKELARVLIDYFIERAEGERNDFERNRADTLERLAKNGTALEEKRQELAQITAYLEKHPTNTEFAKELALEFDKQLRRLNVEIAGLEAQRDRAHRIVGAAQPSHLGTPSVIAMTQLFEKLSVELAGALARKQVINRELTSANKEVRRQALESPIRNLTHRIRSNREKADHYSEVELDPPFDCFTPPVVVDGVVTIAALKP